MKKIIFKCLCIALMSQVIAASCSDPHQAVKVAEENFYRSLFELEKALEQKTAAFAQCKEQYRKAVTQLPKEEQKDHLIFLITAHKIECEVVDSFFPSEDERCLEKLMVLNYRENTRREVQASTLHRSTKNTNLAAAAASSILCSPARSNPISIPKHTSVSRVSTPVANLGHAMVTLLPAGSRPCSPCTTASAASLPLAQKIEATEHTFDSGFVPRHTAGLSYND